MFLRSLATLAALALVVSTVLVSPAHPQATNAVTSSAALPFSGSIFDSVTGETVDISGNLHIVTQVTISTAGDTLMVHTTLPADVVATGRTSGLRYIANGTTIQDFAFPPGSFIPPTPIPNKVKYLKIVFQSVIITSAGPSPTGQPHPSDTILSALTLEFAPDGTLLVDSSSVSLCGDLIGSCQNN